MKEALLALACGVMFVAGAEDLVLAERGAAAYTIVVPEKASPSQRYAAEELRDFTEQMTGVSVVNQLMFVFNLALFGAISGPGIFTAQYAGQKNDEDSGRR